MYKDVTIIMPDKSVSIDGIGVVIGSSVDASIHAIQWHNGAGHVEFSDEFKPNLSIQGQSDYEHYVFPYVCMWEERYHEVTTTEQYPELTKEQQIKSLLLEIDLESVRPLRAKAYGTATPEDDAKLAALEQEAEAVRAELAGLS